MWEREKKKILGILFLSLFVTIVQWGFDYWQRSHQVIPRINDGSAEWSSVETVSFYFDGIGTAPTKVTKNQSTVKELIKQVTNVSEYQKVSQDDYLEGMNRYWVEFDNGVCLNLYGDQNYGCITNEKSVTGTPPFYHFPEEFWWSVKEMADTLKK